MRCDIIREASFLLNVIILVKIGADLTVESGEIWWNLVESG